MSNNPVLLHAATEARGLLASMLASPIAKSFSEKQQDLIMDVLTGLRAAMVLPGCATPWEWFTMEHHDIDRIKETGQRILVFVPYKLVPHTGTSPRKQLHPPKMAFAHWVRQAPQATAAVTPGKQALALHAEHGGFWAGDRRGIKPIRGMPSLWAYLPDIGDLAR